MDKIGVHIPASDVAGKFAPHVPVWGETAVRVAVLRALQSAQFYGYLPKGRFLKMNETFNCFICGKDGCTEKDYCGDGIYVCQECEKFSSAANLLLSVPSEEIEYLADFVEADTENDLYEISEAVMVRVNKVREWLKAVEHRAHPTAAGVESAGENSESGGG